MKFSEIKEKAKKDLIESISEKREELRTFRFKAKNGQLKAVRTLRVTKKAIAQMLTALNAKK